MGFQTAAGVSLSVESPRTPEAMCLIRELDAYQTALYPAESNHLLDIDSLCESHVRFLVARRLGRAVACGALVVHAAAAYGEVKRMYVRADARGLKIGKAILSALEDCARHEGLRYVRLETGIHQPEAIGMYRSAGYQRCEAFGTYKPDPLSIFMEKAL